MKNLNLKTILRSIAFVFAALMGVGLFAELFDQASQVFASIPVIDTLTHYIAPASAALATAPLVVKIKDEDGNEFEFKEKSKEEIEALNASELGAYFANKSKAEKVLLEKRFNEKIEALEKSKSSSEDTEKLQREIEALKTKQKEAIQEMEAYAVKVKALGETAKSNSGLKTFAESFKEAVESNEAFKSVANGGVQKEPIVLVTKDPVTIGLDTTVEAVGSASQVSVTRNTGIISTLRKRILKYLSSGVSISSLVGYNKAMWIEELDEQGNPIFIGEGDDKIQLSVRYSGS
jgi:hypothetical protein